MAVGVFISYNHEDIRIANALKQCLNALSSEIKVFIDHAGLVSGDEYEPTLARNIAGAQWFLMICSGPHRPERDMGWCLMEAGQFRTKLLGENREKLIRSRLVAIHDDIRPRQMANYESVKISAVNRVGRKLDLKQGAEDLSPFEATDAFKLFSNIIQHSAELPLREMADSDDRSLVREQVRQLIRAFAEMEGDQPLPEVVLQPRISFLLPPNTGVDSVVLSDDTVVTGYEISLREIFGILGTETAWGNIKLRVKEVSGEDPLWITDVEEAAVQVSRGLAPEQPDGLCLSVAERQSDVRFYRVLFARYVPFRGGARTCYIVFIPSRPRQFDVKKRSSILLSALILSIRFRQRVLPYIEVMREAPRTKKIENLFTFERTLHQVETEAIEFGLVTGVDEDELPLLQIVRAGDKKNFMEKSITEWTTGRGVLGTAISQVRRAESETSRTEAVSHAEKVVIEELEKVHVVNGDFIQALTEELLFLEKVGKGD